MTQESAYLQCLVRELVALPAETTWVEFKHNNTDAQQIGEYLSALDGYLIGAPANLLSLWWGQVVTLKNQCVKCIFLI